MITLRKYLTPSLPALALGLALTTLASPGFAEYPISAAREQALRECNARVAKLYTRIWTTEQFARYRDCMAEHGQPE